MAPGASTASIGTFTVSNNATLGGAVVLKLNTANAPAINDKLVVTGTLTGGGTLLVTNIGAAITNGTTFKLFNQGVAGIAATLPSGGGSYNWNNNLAANGTITLMSGGVVPINTNPTNIVTAVSNGLFTLTWPSDHTGWRLQVQTNPLSAGLSPNPTNWYTVPSSTNVNTESFQMDPTQGSIFYRLVYP